MYIYMVYVVTCRGGTWYMYIYMVYVVTCRGVPGICIYMVYVVTCRGVPGIHGICGYM